jgi:cyclopropane fatty-acyl-phospholipid synthase-like methyltransferase
MTIPPNSIPHDWFREWFDSPYYHKLYFERDEKEAAAFIGRLLSVLQLRPGSRLLDVACGRGRHARILASHGYEVTGIDLAADSISFARRFENEHLHFYQHDMRALFYTNYFDAAFNFFTSFGYFRTQREHLGAIRSISRALTGKGVFVLDYLNIKYAEDHSVHQSIKEIDGVSYHLTKWSDKKHFFKRIRIEAQELAAPLEYTEKVAKFTLDDFRGMFAREGLRIKAIYGNYELEQYDGRQSPRLLMIAGKENS